MARLAYDSQFTFGRGQNSVSALVSVRPDELPLLQDARAAVDGSWVEPRGGSQRTHSAALGSGAEGKGGIEFVTAAGIQQLVAFAGDSVYYSQDRGTNWTLIASGLPTGRSWSLARMQVGSTNYLFCANGSTVYYWTGSSWASLAGGPQPTGAKYLAVFNNRLWAAGHDGVRVWASRVGDPISTSAWDTNQGALQIATQTHDNDLTPTGLFPLGSILLVFKRSSMGFIEGFGAQTAFVQVGHRGISQSVGCIAHRTIQAVGNDSICFLSERGFELYRTGANEPICVSSPVQDFIERIAFGNIQDDDSIPSATYWPLKREYQCAVPLGGSEQNNARFVFRPPNERSPVPMLATFTAAILSEDQGTVALDENGYLEFQSGAGGFKYSLDSGGYLALSETGSFYELEAVYLQAYEPDYAMQTLFTADRETEFSRPYAVGYEGFVRALETGELDDVLSDDTGGAQVNGVIEFRPFHHGNPFTKAKARRVRITALASGDATVNVDVYADDELVSTETMAFSAGVKAPTPVMGRTGGKAYIHRLRATLTGPVKVHGAELGFRPLRRMA